MKRINYEKIRVMRTATVRTSCPKSAIHCENIAKPCISKPEKLESIQRHTETILFKGEGCSSVKCKRNGMRTQHISPYNRMKASYFF